MKSYYYALKTIRTWLWCLSVICTICPCVLATDRNVNAINSGTSSSATRKIRLSDTGKLAIKLEVQTVFPERVEESISLPGKIEPIPTLQYAQHAALAGQIISIAVQPGQFVRTGDVLAVLQSQELNKLAADALQSKAQILSDISQQTVMLEDEVKQSKAKLEFADANYRRDKMLFDHGLASQEEVQLALSDLSVAQSRYSAALQKQKITLKSLQEKLAITMEPLHKRLALLGLGKKEIDTMLRSEKSIGVVPVRSSNDGLITEIKATSGQSIDPTVLLFTVTDIRKLWATASTYEEDIAAIHIGQDVHISVPSYPNEAFTGRITYIGTQLDATSRTLPVHADIANPELRLKPDMYARLDIEAGAPKDTILLPQDAVVQSGGESLVFLDTGDGFSPIKVEIGKAHGKRIEITHGISAGNKVVTHGAFALLGEWQKIQLGEGAFSRASGEGEVESPQQSEKSNALSISPVMVALLVLIAFVGGIIVAAFVLRVRKRQEH